MRRSGGRERGRRIDQPRVPALSANRPFLGLPRLAPRPLELAVYLEDEDEAERQVLLENGWRVRDPHVVAATPWDYHEYVQQSLGEFSFAKPCYVSLQTGWVSERTI